MKRSTALKFVAHIKIPDILWSPLSAAFLTVFAGFLSLAAHQIWLIPSIGPTVYLHTVTPQLSSSRFYNTVVGHFAAIGAGFFAVLITGAAQLPSVLVSHELTRARVWASGLAILGTLLIQVPFKAIHAPASATALLISLGAFEPTWAAARTIAFAVLIIAVFGEIFRQIRLAQLEQR